MKDAPPPSIPLSLSPSTAEGTLKRNIGPLGVLGLSLSIVNGWVGMAATILLGLPMGGTVVILYGLIGVSFVVGFVILSLAELVSAWPTAGGQYVWSAILTRGVGGGGDGKTGKVHEGKVEISVVGSTQSEADTADKGTSINPSITSATTSKHKYPLAFAVAWSTIFEWIVGLAACSLVCAQTILGLVELFNPDVVVHRWQMFLAFELINTNSMVINVFFMNRMPNLGTFFIVLSMGMYLVLIILCPAAADTHASNSFVWGHWQNDTGWENKGIVVCLGLMNPAFVWAGIDGAIHLAEDCLDAGRSVALALLETIVLGFATGFSLAVALLYSVQDIATASAAMSPFLAIVVQATNSKVAGAIFGVLYLLMLQLMTNSVQMASSRLIWSFARDEAVPYWRNLAHVSVRWRVPVLPIVLSWTGATVLGLLYIASATVYNSIVSCVTILQNVAISIVLVQLLVRRRRMNPTRWLRLGKLGWAANVITVVWSAVTTVLWLFPYAPNPSPKEMNYSIAVLAVMVLIAGLDWFCYAREHFKGPSAATLHAMEEKWPEAAAAAAAVRADAEAGVAPVGDMKRGLKH